MEGEGVSTKRPTESVDFQPFKNKKKSLSRKSEECGVSLSERDDFGNSHGRGRFHRGRGRGAVNRGRGRGAVNRGRGRGAVNRGRGRGAVNRGRGRGRFNRGGRRGRFGRRYARHQAGSAIGLQLGPGSGRGRGTTVEPGHFKERKDIIGLYKSTSSPVKNYKVK